MKKILLAVATVGALFATTACNDSFKSSDNNAGFADSLATGYAQMMGVQMRGQLPMLEAQLGDDFDRKSYEKGLKAGMTLDTADISYMIGLQQGMNLSMVAYQWAKEDIKVNQGKMAKTAIAALNDTTLQMEVLYAQMNQLQQRYQQLKEEKANKERQAKAEANAEAGKKYLADLQKKDADVKVTESGLGYKITASGDETRANDTDIVSVVYTGKHLDGSEFDSSHGEPVPFELTRVVPGFTEGLKLIGKGGKATLYIPGELGYGENGQPMAGIEPNEMLVFEVEITNIEPQAAE
ncbi:MAG: FKBP-type peptidyl-prolyl cis-trans isomerase [Muribaculaceae bacterium]|nr:FKBP-type peptidyl-prolyl cis-trans isomerase [Muribaculaceae bacterium]